MKSKAKWGLALMPLALVGSSTLGASHEIQFKDLPALVQQTITRYKDNGEIKRIEQQTYNGATVYDVLIKRVGPNRDLHITANGAVLENDPNFVANPGSLQTRKLQLSDLPQPVQNTIRSRLGNVAIDDIDHATLDGRAVYEVEFQRGGQNQEVHIASDGTLFQGAQASARQAVQPATSSDASSRKIAINELPSLARRTAERAAAGAPIEDIDQMTKNGGTFYEVTFKSNGENVNIDVAADGSLTDQNGSPAIASAQSSTTGDGAVSQVAPRDREVTFAELPLPVMKTVQSEVGSGRIGTIERKVRRDRTLYQVAYFKDGKQLNLFVAETGNVISDGSSANAAAVQKARPVVLSNASKVTLSELPPAVQNTVRAQAGVAPIEDIDKGFVNGRTFYKAAFKKNGQHTELTVAEDGSVVTGVPATASAIPASPETAVPLRDARKVTFNDLPGAAQETIRAQTGAAVIEDIDKGTLNGRVVYEAAFKKDGRHTELRVAEDGSLVGIGAAETSSPPP